MQKSISFGLWVVQKTSKGSWAVEGQLNKLSAALLLPRDPGTRDGLSYVSLYGNDHS